MAKRERAVRKPPSTRKRSTARKRTTAAIDFKKEIANLRRELSRSRLQQTATADVLNVISRSTFDLQAVLDRLTESAARLCNADMAAITRQDAGGFYHATNYNFSVDWVKVTDTFRIQPGRSSVVGRALLEAKPVQIADVLADPEYTYTEFQKAAGYRTLLGVPLLRSGQPIGVLFLGRKNVELFTHQQVKLVSTFADQALIAIENVRLFDEVQTRTEDLRESLQQQTATADVLKVISRSTFDLQTVLDTLVESAARVCEADTGIIRRREGDDYPLAATFGLTVQQREHFASYSPKPDRGSVFGRAILEGRTIHVPDVLADPQYSRPRLQGFVSVRAGLGVPLIREGNVIGVFTLQRREPQPFSQKQIELVTSFADQAVIAIENTRLLSELRESLQQQTATADVLKVISRSPGELEPVFQAMLENATRICEAKFSNLFLREGDAFRAVAVHGEPAYMDSWQREPLIVARDHPGVPLDRLARTNEVLHIQDLTAELPYIEGDRRMIALVDSAGARTMLLVPMLRENALIGAIVIYRQEVRAFTDKQIELVKNFASQAVIAFENARLLNELRESLQQQTATADVLKVISRSTFDLPTVLQTLVESATRLCDADKATITRQKDGVFFRAEAYGFSDEFMDYARTVPVVADRGSAIGRALLERAAVHIPDVEADADFTFTEGRRLGGFRTILGVPMLREGVPIGVITMTRSEVRPFTDKQIELATTFADQAAIAMENVRLFDEVQAKTRDLSDALMYQTGSANILKVIASSPTDVGPVLQAIAESACELCEAVDASVFLRNDNHLTFSGHHGPLSIPDDKMPINRDWVAGRAFLDQKPVHVDDLQSDDGDYLWGRQFAEKHGHRTTLGVPLLRENESIGAIVVRRMEVRPFTVRQIELIRTFRSSGDCHWQCSPIRAGTSAD
ncbi:GAF domain-containing protein [Bradyrhizobium sp.]|uniref:GAF domain-containing protein n=1 Tax=Bradyrhizobium sp. TaxID=376 RepID=UPI003C72B42F